MKLKISKIVGLLEAVDRSPFEEAPTCKESNLSEILIDNFKKLNKHFIY